MRIFHSTDDLPAFNSPVVTMGSYDGVHYGHRALLDVVKNVARRAGGESVVVTFSPHPRQVLPHGGKVELLNTQKEKTHLLSELGIDNLIIFPFTEETAAIPPYDFVKDILVGKIGMKHFVIGYDHRFGYNQEGDYGMLKELGREFGFDVERVGRADIDDSKVSSTVARRMITEGRMDEVAEFLVHGYIIIAGVHDGRRITGVRRYKLLPPPGKYPVTVSAGDFSREDTLEVGADGSLYLEAGVPREIDEVTIVFR